MSMAPVEAAKIIGVLFIVIHFLIVVGIVKDGDLATVEHEDPLVIDMDADRLVESGGIALPGHSIETVTYSFDQPNIAGQGGDEGISIGKEGHAGQLHDGVVGVVIWDGQGVRCKLIRSWPFPVYLELLKLPSSVFFYFA